MITVSEMAASKAKLVLEQRGRPDGALRLFVAGGGCSGPQFGMALAGDAEADDTELEFGGVRFLVDNESAPYLEGAEVDYVEDRDGRRLGAVRLGGVRLIDNVSLGER